MRKSLLAVAALTGAGVGLAEAAMFKVDEETYANFGYASQIWAQHLGKADQGEKSRTDFSVNNAKIYFSGQVQRAVKFHVEVDASVGRGRETEGRTRIGDAHVRLSFAPEFELIAGYQRLPFSRQTLTSTYTSLFPTEANYGRVAGGAPVFESVSIGAAGVGSSGSRDAGLSVFSNLMDGMVVFRGGIFDGGYDNRITGQFDESLAYAFRVQFTPITLGYKGETGYSLSDTYLGKQDVLTFGVGYNTQKDKVGGNTWKMLTLDMQWEQKRGEITPNLQVGYNDLKDYNPNKDDARAFWIQGQLLHNHPVGIGKPALALGWYYSEDKPAGGGNKAKVNRYSVYFNYYIKGQRAKVQVGADTFRRNSEDKGNTGKNYTDFTFALQTQF